MQITLDEDYIEFTPKRLESFGLNSNTQIDYLFSPKNKPPAVDFQMSLNQPKKVRSII